MKKLIIVLVMLFSFSSVLSAQEEYTSLELKETLEMDGKSTDLSGYEYNDKKINLYLFWGKGCPHCSDFMDFIIDDIIKESGKYFNFYGYEVWKTPNNSILLDKVAKYFNVSENEAGVPFIVIGDKYFVGFGENVSDNLSKIIKETYDAKSDIDVVKGILEGKIDVTKETSAEERDPNKIYSSFEQVDEALGFKDEKSNENKKDNNLIVYIVSIIVFVVLVSIGVIFFVRKKRVKK